MPISNGRFHVPAGSGTTIGPIGSTNVIGIEVITAGLTGFTMYDSKTGDTTAPKLLQTATLSVALGIPDMRDLPIVCNNGVSIVNTATGPELQVYTFN